MAFRLEGYHQGEYGSESLKEACFLVLSFVLGAYACGLLIDKNQVHFLGKAFYGLALVLNSTLLVLAAFLPGRLLPVCFVSAACGLQNAMCTSHFGAIIRTTHVTGTVTDIGSTLGRISMIYLRKGCRRSKLDDVELAEVSVDSRKLAVLMGLWSFYFVGGLENIIPGPPERALLLPATFTGGLGLFYMEYIKKLERERFESDLEEAHKVLVHMGSRLHSLETSDHSVVELDEEMGQMIEALHEVEADFENLCRQKSQILERSESMTSKGSSKASKGDRGFRSAGRAAARRIPAGSERWDSLREWRTVGGLLKQVLKELCTRQFRVRRRLCPAPNWDLLPKRVLTGVSLCSIFALESIGEGIESIHSQAQIGLQACPARRSGGERELSGEREPGLDFTFVPPKGERRPEMLKQSSVPNLVHDRSEVLRGGDVRRGLREQRASKVASQTQAYDPRDPRPGLRHSSSATSLGRGPGREELRRPMRYDSASSLFHTPDHASFAKSDALQLESRLTQRLREYSFSNIEPTRRPRRKSPSVPREELRPGLFERELRAGRSPYRPGAVSWPEGAYSFHSTATPSKSRASATSSPYPQSTYSQFGGAPTEEGESQLKIYSDLFEEVIERDRVFGPLLRKVKGAYDSLLSQAPQAPSIPAMPAPREERTPGSLRASRSSEPTLRVEAPADAWELHRENQALKDLIERLHMELEEAVKREQRWKAKAAKLKVETLPVATSTQPLDRHEVDGRSLVVMWTWPEPGLVILLGLCEGDDEKWLGRKHSHSHAGHSSMCTLPRDQLQRPEMSVLSLAEQSTVVENLFAELLPEAQVDRCWIGSVSKEDAIEVSRAEAAAKDDHDIRLRVALRAAGWIIGAAAALGVASADDVRQAVCNQLLQRADRYKAGS
ncbi:Uncharacterized protein SCF082_LOCUS36760 [Durusdinium trenchii]|uniref:Uncharacterized protein n=1 Tax=Durusdinium trenchii TaxID=1381693 RepID=A0ABP0PKT5_9DINO